MNADQEQTDSACEYAESVCEGDTILRPNAFLFLFLVWPIMFEQA